MGGERNDICNTCTTFLVTIMNELSIKNVTLQVFRKHLINNDYLPSRQILVPRTSRGCPPPTSPGRPLKILFDRPGEVPI